MTRPEPRKSALAGRSVISQPKPPKPSPKPDTQKITVTISEEVANAARGAYLAQLPHGGPRTWSQWVEDALNVHTRTITESLHTSVTAIPPGVIPPGRALE